MVTTWLESQTSNYTDLWYKHLGKPTIEDWYLAGMEEEKNGKYLYFDMQKWGDTQHEAKQYTTTANDWTYKSTNSTDRSIYKSVEHIPGYYGGTTTATPVQRTYSQTGKQVVNAEDWFNTPRTNYTNT